MPSNAMILSSDSLNPAASAEMPLYAVLVDGQFEIIDPRDIEDTPCYTLTPAGLEELPPLLPYLQEQPGEFILNALAKRGIDTTWMDEVRS